MSCRRCGGSGTMHQITGQVGGLDSPTYQFRVVTCPGCLGTGTMVEATPDQEG